MKRKPKPAPSRSHEAATIESFRKEPVFAAEYLNAILADEEQDEVMLALRRLSQAFGGVAKVAKTADLNATALYRTLSSKGNSEMKSLSQHPFEHSECNSR